MNENHNNYQSFEDEIDLKEIVMAIWKRKKMILSISLLAAIISAMFSMFVLTPVYNTNLNIVISMPETYNTRYGEYKLPLTSNEQYINLILSNNVLIKTIEDMGYNDISIEDLRKKITIDKAETKAGTIQNSFDVIVSSDNPEESLKLAQTLFDNYLDFTDAMLKERIVEYYDNYFKVELRSLENDLYRVNQILRKNEELLSQISKTIDTGGSNIEIHTPLNSTSNYAIPVSSTNPNYIKIENDIIENKQTINSIENDIKMYNSYLEEIEFEKQVIHKYYRTGEVEKLESSLISIIETSVYLPSSPVAPTQKTSPSNALNTIIGIGIGVVLGIMIALFKEYWFNETIK